MCAADPTTIVAISTPRGTGGIGLVRICGPEALQVAAGVFVSRTRISRRPRYVHVGHVVGDDGQPLDSALAWYLPAARSYTGEDTVEISTHGNDVLLELVVDAARSRGARLAEAGEFTRRALVNGRIDLMQAEGVVDLIQAGSRRSLSAAYGAVSGRLSQRASGLRDYVVDALVQLESRLDFVDDVAAEDREALCASIRKAQSLAEELAQTCEGARRRRTGWSVTLAGFPNAGKSTLFNALLGEDRSIVAADPGTTRDWVEGRVVWDGDVVRLIDTAGLREGASGVEKEGVDRTRRLVADADVVIHVIDGSRPVEEPLPDLGNARTVVALAKGDLAHSCHVPGAIRVSGLRGCGLDQLRAAATALLPGRCLGEGDGLSRERHHAALQDVARSCARGEGHAREGSAELAAAELQRALRAVGGMLGEGVEEDVLDRIFADFCIGK